MTIQEYGAYRRGQTAFKRGKAAPDCNTRDALQWAFYLGYQAEKLKARDAEQRAASTTAASA
jgi:hypothetical protein